MRLCATELSGEFGMLRQFVSQLWLVVNKYKCLNNCWHELSCRTLSTNTCDEIGFRRTQFKKLYSTSFRQSTRNSILVGLSWIYYALDVNEYVDDEN